MDNTFLTIGDMQQSFLARMEVSKKPQSERSVLVGFFAEQLAKTPRVIGIRLAHYSVPDLYSIKSAYNDRLNRNSKESADKWFWWSTKLSTVAES